MVSSRRLKFIEPMKAAIATAPPHNGEWLYEVKFDGFRVLAIKNGKDIELWSRNKKRLDERFPSIVEAVKKLDVRSCVMDGEVCALDNRGKTSFQLLQNAEEHRPTLVYYVFDLLFQNSENLQDLSLLERKERLQKVLAGAAKPILPSAFFMENPGRVLEKMEMVGAEGAIAKLKTSVYEAGQRSGAWIKIKFHKQQEFVVVGYTLPKNSRPYFGALLLGYYQGKRLIFAGRVGTGFNDKSLKEIHGKMKPLASEVPWVEEVQEPSGRWRPRGWKASDTRWIKPRLVAQVQFTEWTDDGVLRHPSFLGLRDDKDPGEVLKES